jgi:RNA polymerase-binding transcription factor DksA
LDVLNALKRIEQGDFGVCNFCGKEISLDRLTAFPEVQTCVFCA